MKRLERIYCDPLFKKKVKKLAIDEGLSVADLTKKLGESDDPLAPFRNNENKKKWNFRI